MGLRQIIGSLQQTSSQIHMRNLKEDTFFTYFQDICSSQIAFTLLWLTQIYLFSSSVWKKKAFKAELDKFIQQHIY